MNEVMVSAAVLRQAAGIRCLAGKDAVGRNVPAVGRHERSTLVP